MFAARLAIVTVVLVPWPLLAQAPLEKQAGVGVANLVLPTVSAGVDALSPSGLSVGGHATLFTTGAWAMYGASARAGLQGRYGRDRVFLFAELGYFNETDCCGAKPLIGFGGGITRWGNRASALRVEGRLLLPLAGDGGAIILQIGRTFR
jgi:hypothetical protein